MAKYAAAIDQGTTSTRCMIFDHGGQVVSVAQKEHEQIYPKPGWVEHDADGDLGAHAGGRRRGDRSRRAPARATSRASASPTSARPRWCGTAPPASRSTTRSCGRTRAPTSSSTSSPRRRPGALPGEGRPAAGDLLLRPEDPLDPRQRRRRRRARRSPATCCSATWTPGCIWNLTGGTDGGLHITDVTNASRTMLMDLKTLDWDDEIMDVMGVPRAMLPEIKASSEVYGEVSSGGALQGVPIAGDLGDQQAATFGQTCFAVGEAKNTYGTGNFLLLNTGTEAVHVEVGPADDRRLQDRRPGRDLLPRGLDRDHRRARAVAARQPQDDQGRAGGRGPRAVGRRQRRLLHRAGVLGPVRAVLEVQRARRRRGPDPLRQRRPHRPRDARGDRVPEPRGRRGDERRLGRRRSSRSRSTAAWSATTC